MHFIYADLENIGLRSFKQYEILDDERYFVASKNKAVQAYCQQQGLSCFSNYSTAKNAADNLLKQKLRETLKRRNQAELETDRFTILTNDRKLIRDFVDCFHAYGTSKVKYANAQTLVYLKNKLSFTQIVLAQFKQPNRAYDAWYNLPNEYDDYQAFLREFNKLVRDQWLVRCSSRSQKHWIVANRQLI